MNFSYTVGIGAMFIDFIERIRDYKIIWKKNNPDFKVDLPQEITS